MRPVITIELSRRAGGAIVARIRQERPTGFVYGKNLLSQSGLTAPVRAARRVRDQLPPKLRRYTVEFVLGADLEAEERKLNREAAGEKTGVANVG